MNELLLAACVLCSCNLTPSCWEEGMEKWRKGLFAFAPFPFPPRPHWLHAPHTLGFVWCSYVGGLSLRVVFGKIKWADCTMRSKREFRRAWERKERHLWGKHSEWKMAASSSWYTLDTTHLFPLSFKRKTDVPSFYSLAQAFPLCSWPFAVSQWENEFGFLEPVLQPPDLVSTEQMW